MAMQSFRAISALVLGLSLSSGLAAEEQAQDAVPSRMQTGTDIYMEAAFREFDAHLADCTKTYGYDPDDVADEGEYELGPGEDEWRACAYEGVEKILIPNSRSPELYRTLINTHRILTTQMQRGAVTRSERRSRIDELLLEIQLAEAKEMPPDSGTPRESKASRDARMRNQLQPLRSLGLL